MEGLAGVTHYGQCYPKQPAQVAGYQQACAAMAVEVAWVIEAALNAGIDAIVINDAHSTMTNLSLDAVMNALPEKHRTAALSLISGKPKQWAMMAGLDETFEAAMLIGYHAMAGTGQAVLAHSFIDAITSLKLNGTPVGEITLNQLWAAHHGVPVVLVSGDQQACKEASGLVGPIQTVETKRSTGWHTAELSTPEVVRQRYQQAVIRAFQTPAKPGPPTGPFTLEIGLCHPLLADVASLSPDVSQRLDGLTIQMQGDVLPELLRRFQTVYTLIASQSFVQFG